MSLTRSGFVIALALAGPLAAGAAIASGAPAASSTRTVTDDSARVVQVRAAPLRIVSLSPGGTEMLFAAGAGPEVVATVEYSDVPPEAKRVLRIGDAVSIDLERLVRIHPDVVVAWPAGGNPAQRAKIARLDIPVYEQEAKRLAELAPSIRRLGVLAGTVSQADAAARAIEARLESLRRTYAGAEDAARQPSVLLEVWNRPIYTVGGQHLMTDALELCGARNVFADLPEAGPVVDIEAVIARDPDIIIAAGPPGESAAWLTDWKRFTTLRAVHTQRLVAFEDQGLSRLGPSVLDATEALCRAIANVGVKRK
ncbi:MAG TPA: helical backbone metal receptor [Steroidobacteraceae bacterium]|nr:helical backbone metal receptor [Steroidobacteraceae bacterium]